MIINIRKDGKKQFKELKLLKIKTFFKFKSQFWALKISYETDVLGFLDFARQAPT